MVESGNLWKGMDTYATPRHVTRGEAAVLHNGGLPFYEVAGVGGDPGHNDRE